MRLSVTFGAPTMTVSTGMPVARELVGADVYDGEYEVTPSAHEAQTLQTTNKLLLDDVTVIKIPYYETSNLSNGYTAYIASEV